MCSPLDQRAGGGKPANFQVFDGDPSSKEGAKATFSGERRMVGYLGVR
jgi:hypothetical protein